MMRVRMVWICLAVAAPVWVACAGGHPIPESERWATITHPGNEAYQVLDPDGLPDRLVGRVDYEYQIGRTEVTAAEWFEFVQAYAPYVQEDGWSSPAFTSWQIGIAGYRQYSLPPQNANKPVEIGWHFAARYTNWLHNGKATNPEAFESGAYDTTTFVQEPDGGWTDQVSRSPGATYWIPSEDEWIKAANFDPDRYGEGMPGYWLATNSSDTPPTYGPPGTGQSSAAGSSRWALPDVASYPGTQSPWGLLDTSGGFDEWTEGVIYYPQVAEGFIDRITLGSSYRDSRSFIIFARLEYIDGANVNSPLGLVGLRIARAVPAPGMGGVLCVCAIPLLLRRRNRCHDTESLVQSGLLDADDSRG